MDEERYQQKELFEFQKPKRFFPRLSSFFRRTELAGKTLLVLTLEKMIFAAIGMIMLLVGVYAIGVERGRGIGRAVDTQPPSIRVSPVTQNVPAPPRIPQSVTMESTVVKIKTMDVKLPYTIVAATFSNKDTAEREAKRLRADGLGASVVPSDRYHQIHVGSYATKENAQAALKKVRARYKDAYIKTR